MEVEEEPVKQAKLSKGSCGRGALTALSSFGG
jgi:hypothetical protein